MRRPRRSEVVGARMHPASEPIGLQNGFRAGVAEAEANHTALVPPLLPPGVSTSVHATIEQCGSRTVRRLRAVGFWNPAVAEARLRRYPLRMCRTVAELLSQLLDEEA